MYSTEFTNSIIITPKKSKYSNEILNKNNSIGQLKQDLDSSKRNFDFDSAKKTQEQIKNIEQALEYQKLSQINDEIIQDKLDTERNNQIVMEELKQECKKEITEETLNYKIKLNQQIENLENQYNNYEIDLNAELKSIMKYESPQQLKLRKELDVSIKKNDFSTAKKKNKEIDYLVKQDDKILQNRIKECKRHLLKQFKDKQQKLIEHFKSSYETVLINLQNKWNDKLEKERKKLTRNDQINFKKQRSRSENQLINLTKREKEVSFDTKLSNKDKTRWIPQASFESKQMPKQKILPVVVSENKRVKPITRSKVQAQDEIQSLNQSFVKTNPQDLFNKSHTSIFY